MGVLMTKEEFHKEYCMMCGTQRCPGRPEDMDDCGNYKHYVLGHVWDGLQWVPPAWHADDQNFRNQKMNLYLDFLRG